MKKPQGARTPKEDAILRLPTINVYFAGCYGKGAKVLKNGCCVDYLGRFKKNIELLCEILTKIENSETPG